SVSSASEVDHPDAVEEQVDEGAFEMASLDHHGLGLEVADCPRRTLHRPDVPYREAGEPLRFVAVRGHEGSAIEEAFDEGRSEIVLLEPRARGRHHHPVYHDRARR